MGTRARWFRVRRLLGFQGMRRFEREYTEAGDLVGVADMETLQVGHALTVEEPT
ncbi:hypothetical protein [Nannocystis pusilla]|uniref:hypothetical protein n=1 Tax=Nannocystis pusilla TaxID=889268 RepID=UPI003BEF7528